MTIPSVDPAPANPDPATDTPSVFSTKAAAFVLWLKGFATQLAATITAMNDAVEQANTDAATATSAAGAATDKAAEAAAFAASAANAPGTNATSTTSVAIPTSLPATFSLTIQPGKSFLNQYVRATATASPENYVEGDIASYNSATGALVLNVRQSQGIGTYAAWSVSLAAPRLVTVSNSIVQKTAAFTAVAADIGRMFECSGTWTMALEAAATLGDGWYVYVTNAGTGTITIDPNASEQIQGANTIQLLPGDTFVLGCDGAGFKARKLDGKQTVILTSGTSWTPPYDINAKITVIGAGGGSKTSTTGGGTRRGRGATGAVKTMQLKRAVAYSIAVGAGGSSGAADSTQEGGAGGTTSFSGTGVTTLTAPGGPATDAFSSPVATGGDFNYMAQSVSDATISQKGPLPGLGGSTYGDGGAAPNTSAAGNPGFSGVIIIEF